jgi:hypothetical protein
MLDARSDGFALRLRQLLAARSIPPTGPALSRKLAQSNRHIHPHTLREILAGRRLPKPATLELILRGLDATDAERELLTSALTGTPPGTTPGVVRLLDALGGLDIVNRGREVEEVTWRYLIGEENDEDRCVEHRLTSIGASGLRLATFGPGEFSRASFDLLDLPTFDVRVQARLLVRGAAAVPVPTTVHVMEVEPARSSYRLVAQFSEVPPSNRLEWQASYRWPGLWRSLRHHGVGVGRVSFRGKEPKVTAARVELVAAVAAFPDLDLRPLTRAGSVKRTERSGEVHVSWHVRRPPPELRFEVHAPSRYLPNGPR